METPVEQGCNVTPELLAPVLKAHPEAKAVFTTYNETSTTALADIRGCAALVRHTDNLLVVDAVSALVAEPMQMDDWGVDVLLTSSQKALALPPGLGFIAFSEKAWSTVEKQSCRSMYFDAKAYEREWPRHQSPYTSSLAVLLQLQWRLQRIRLEGLGAIQTRYAKLTTKLRDGLAALGCTFPTEVMGNSTTAARVPDTIDAALFTQKLRVEEGISIGAPYPGQSVVRIGNFGAIGEPEIALCLERMSKILQELRRS